MAVPIPVAAAPRRAPAEPWYREVTREQWKAFVAAYLGWVLDGFDFTILTFLLVDIQRSFTVSAALAGALGTITLIFRVAGGIGAGTAADRWGRKGPLMFSILWYSMFAFFSGFATSFRMLFAPDVVRTTIHTSILMGAFLFMYHSITFWYPTLLGRMQRPALPYMLALNFGAVTGAVAVGRLSEGALGRRGAATVSTLVGILTIPIYVWTGNSLLLWTGALLMGFFGAGNFGVVPAYLNERFPTVVRAAGAGCAYHVGAGIGSLTPALVGRLQDLGFTLPSAMTICIAASC